jgi:hypothetical protein
MRHVDGNNVLLRPEGDFLLGAVSMTAVRDRGGRQCDPSGHRSFNQDSLRRLCSLLPTQGIVTVKVHRGRKLNRSKAPQ